MYSVNQVLGLLTHRPIGWVNFPRKSRVSFNYKSTPGYDLARRVLWNLSFSIDKDSIPSNSWTIKRIREWSG